MGWEAEGRVLIGRLFRRKLKRLNLGGNELTSVPQKALSLLENLRKLEIQENKIRDIKEGDFEGEFSEGRLRRDGPTDGNLLFSNSGLRNLDSLILAHNKLTKVPANVFSHLTLLNSLELEGNNIAYIDVNAFAGLEGSHNL